MLVNGRSVEMALPSLGGPGLCEQDRMIVVQPSEVVMIASSEIRILGGQLTRRGQFIR